jgi:hypothetical protein
MRPSTLGIASPMLTSGRGVAWNSLDLATHLELAIGLEPAAEMRDKAERAGPRRAEYVGVMMLGWINGVIGFGGVQVEEMGRWVIGGDVKIR